MIIPASSFSWSASIKLLDVSCLAIIPGLQGIPFTYLAMICFIISLGFHKKEEKEKETEMTKVEKKAKEKA